VEETETILLPFFRRFLKKRMKKPQAYVTMLGELNEYLTNYKTPISPANLRTYIRYFSNFYSLLHPLKRFEVVLPYFPYKYDYLTGCSEVVIRSKAGIRIYVYDFTDGPVDGEDLNYNGFRLQLAACVYEKLTGITPTSLGCLYPGSKTVVYYTFRPDERLEEMISDKNQFIRRYGTHCAYCLQRNCTPLIDRKDRYGWRVSETN
jgi:hypothetical protein